MFDKSTEESLKALTADELAFALNTIQEKLTLSENTNAEISLAGHSCIAVLQLIFHNISNTILPDDRKSISIDPLAICYIKCHNRELFEVLLKLTSMKKDFLAQVLHNYISSLRDIADEAKYSQSNTTKAIPFEQQQFLGMLTSSGRSILSYIDKETHVENFICLVLKDIKKLHPDIYQQYQEICRSKTGDTPLIQAVKQSISYKYFSGSIKSFCPMYLPDIFASPQYQAMGKNPKYQLLLLDMINLCNYLAGSRKGSGIESNGFYYTWSECPVEVSEDTFQKGVNDIIARGWFKLMKRVKINDGPLVKMYTPSTDWKKKRISEQEIARIQKYKERKRKRLKDSRWRYKDFVAILSRKMNYNGFYNTHD